MRIGAHLAVLGIAAIFTMGATAADAAARSIGTRSVDLSPPAISDTRPGNEAEVFVQSNIDKGYAILNDPSLNADERRIQFRDFLLSVIDTRRIAMFALGSYARDASDSDIKNFVEVYTNFVATLYQRYFDRYKGETLRVTGSTRRSEDDMIVNADVVGRDGVPRFKIGFRVRRGEGRKNIITDLQAEGAWLGLNQRADFTSYLQQHGGTLGPLSSELESRAQRIKELKGT